LSGAAQGSSEHLAKMANDIADFFRSEPERKDAVAGIANHIAKFWTPRMRQKLADFARDQHGAGLDELSQEALRLLATPGGAPHPHEPPGGDAG
jgi:formate dehydrogenase subunit delta